SIFQHRYTFNIIGVYMVNRLFYTVNDDQWIIIIQRPLPSYPDGCPISTGLTTRLIYINTSYPLQCLRRAGNWSVFQIFRTDRFNRSGNIYLLLRAIAHDHHFLQIADQRIHRNVDVASTVYRQFNPAEPDHTKNK